MVDEFAGGVLKELDYRNEAYHAKRLADNMARFPEITVPRIYDELSGSRVLTMEFVRGIKISDADGAARGRLRHRGARARVHPGGHQAGAHRRLLPRRPASRQPHGGPGDQRLVFLDLGLVGQLSAPQRVDLLGLIYAVKEVDIRGIADGLIALGKPTAEFDEPQFRADIDRLARQYLVYGTADSIGGALTVVHERRVRQRPAARQQPDARDQGDRSRPRRRPVPSSPDVDLAQPRRSRRRQAALLESLEPDNVAKRCRARPSGRQGARPGARRRSRRRRSSGSTSFNQGKIAVEVDTSRAHRRRSTEVSGLGRQATVGLIVVGQLIGTAIAMTILLQPALAAFTGLAYAAMIAFAVTLLVSFWVLFRLLLRGGSDA